MRDQGTLHAKGTFGKVPEPLIHDMTISHGAARLYGHMHWRYGANHCNFEGTRSMADTFGVSQKTICNWIAELESANWVVTLLRDKNSKTGNFQTPFYHVFEDQEDCALFRVTYRPQEGEVIAPKPQVKERRSRKGVGGKPSHKLTRSTQVDRDTYGSQVPQAHDTQVPSIQTQVIQTQLKDSAADAAQGENATPQGKAETAKARSKRLVFDPIYDALEAAFWQTVEDSGAFAPDEDKTNGGRIAKVAWWHCGKPYKGVRTIGNPATEENVQQHVDAIQAFAAWLKSSHNNITIHDLTKYVEWYGKWYSQRSVRQQRQQAAIENAPTREETEMTPEQKMKLRDYLQRQSRRQRRLA